MQLLKGQTISRGYKYHKSMGLVGEERFYQLTCRQARDKDGNQVPLLDKEGNPVFYQLQYFVDSDTEALNEEQRQILLQDPRYKDPVAGKVKRFPYKTLLRMARVLTEADGKEWLTTSWVYEGLRKDKGIEPKAFKFGDYEHPLAEYEQQYIDPQDKEKGTKSIITAVHEKTVYEIPFTKENVQKILAERSAPKDEKHINMTLVKIGPSGMRNPFTLEVTNKEQFLTRPFMELWDYLASAPAKNTAETKMGKEKDRDKNKHYG